MNKYIYGMHDDYAASELLPGSVVVIAEKIGHGPEKSGRDYGYLKNMGLHVIVNLRHGWGDGKTGNIPTPDLYDAFAERAARFVKNSYGAQDWVIGNEPNHLMERAENIPISPVMYASCFLKTREAIRRTAGTHHRVMVAAIAPWNCQTVYSKNLLGDWVLYFKDTLRAIGENNFDGVALHAYTHGQEITALTRSNPMGPPFQNREFDWFVLSDWMEVVDSLCPGTPVHVTEANPGADLDYPEWTHTNSGWVDLMYSSVDSRNQRARALGRTVVRSVSLFRAHPNADVWGITPGTIADLQNAMEHKYTWQDETQEPFSLVCPHCGGKLSLIAG